MRWQIRSNRLIKVDLSSLTPEQLADAINNGTELSSLVQKSSHPESESCGLDSNSVPTISSGTHASGGNTIDNLSLGDPNEHPQLSVGNGVLESTSALPVIPDYVAINRFIGGSSLDNGKFDGIDIQDPVELLVLLEDDIRTGETKLHPWQITFMLDFANSKHTKESPFQAAVQACNSSGKDKYVIAACAVWLCMRYRDVICPITSSSGEQLDKQTCAHITRLSNKANVLFASYGLSWKINYRDYKFLHVDPITGRPCTSQITLFATDEPGKAEGYHPLEKGKKMAVFTSETKSIPSDITDAIERCTGFTHRVDASSPGAAAGYFYNVCSYGIARTSISDIKQLDSTQIILYKITAYDCPHITPSEINRFAAKQPGGVNSIVYRSSILAEFGSTDEQVVIPSDMVHRAVENTRMFCKIQWIQEQCNHAGFDISMGGAESVICVRNGNKLIGMEYANIHDTSAQISWAEEMFFKHKLNNPDSKIRGDYVGIGGPILQILKKTKKWDNIIYVDSRNKASEFKTYKNRGTELFFHVRSLFEKKHIILFYDKELIEQLCSRHFKVIDAKIHQLLSKQEERNKGFVSPDRADALNLCFWGYERTDLKEDESNPPYKQKELEEVYDPSNEAFDLKSWANRGRKMYQPDHVEISEMKETGLIDEINHYNQQLLMRR